MKNPFAIVFSAAKTVLERKGYKIVFALLALSAAVLFVLMPVWSVPGNDISFQLSLFTAQNWLLFFVLALLIALLLTTQIFIFMRAKNIATKTKSLGGAAGGVVGGYTGILGGVFATAACSWCAAAIFGFLGTGAILFIVRNQLWVVLAAISILLVSLYFASRKVIDSCGCTPREN